MTTPTIPVALQLYTLRHDTAQDFTGTLEKVAALGYHGVEFAGYGGLAAGELRRRLDDLGLRVAGCHVSLERLEADLEAEMAYALEIGSSALVCPFLPESRRADEAGWLAVAAGLESAASRCAAQNLTLAYHNHAFELEHTVGGRPAHEALFEAAPGLAAELDVYWVQVAGASPVEFMRRLAGRLPLLHLKDLAPDPVSGQPTTAELGQGVLDLSAVLEAAPACGARWYIVEQDDSRRPPLESVAISLEYLRGRGLVG